VSQGAASPLRFLASDRAGEVAGLLLRPEGAERLLVLAHGAGADMRHAFMEAISGRLASHGIATLRYQFPYAERGGRRPDPQPVLLATVRAAIAMAGKVAGDLPLLAASLAAAASPLPRVDGLVFFGFPLHAAGRPGRARAEHLDAVKLPLLFLQGSRDRLADPSELRAVCRRLGARATLHVVPEGDHSFHVLKRTGRSDAEVRDELAATVDRWAELLRSKEGDASRPPRSEAKPSEGGPLP
jgi:predicted alpha/beta-hydrolase family hydrolase